MSNHYLTEHNVEHRYEAYNEYKQYFQYLDPTNSFNRNIDKYQHIKSLEIIP